MKWQNLQCHRHGETKFSLQKDGRYRCAACSSQRAIEHRRKMKIKAIEYKGGKCSICDYSKCNAALEFHHLDPSEKDFQISGRGCTISWERLKIELDKTVLVCANCHREIHDKI